MDPNGHIRPYANSGVIGDHNAVMLNVIWERPVEQVEYFRLYFAGENGTVMTEKLIADNGQLQYTLPAEVTGLGRNVLGQLCGYAGEQEQLSLLYKSDTFPLVFATTLPDTTRVVQDGLTDRLNDMIDKVETIANQFDLQIGNVTTVDYNQQASASLEKDDDMVYKLHLAVPKGEKGDGDFSPGKRVTIVNGEISVDSRAQVYNGLANLYGYVGIDENKTIAELGGTVFYVNPIYASKTATCFYTKGEEVYQPLYYYKNGIPQTPIPADSVIPGRLMAIYVTTDGLPIYLNPYEAVPNPLPVYTITPIADTSFPTLNLSATDYTEFTNGKTIVALLTDDLVFNKQNWLGPLSCYVKIFDGSNWVNTNRLYDKTISAGQPLMLSLRFDPDNYSFSEVKWLNPPA